MPYPTVTYPVGRAVNVNVGTGMHDLTPIINGMSFTGASIAAHAGGGQALATPITSALTLVATVATAADSVALPPSTGGQLLWLSNGTANAMQVFAAVGTTNTINGIAGSTGISIAAGKSDVFISPIGGAWFTVASA